ncbi:hypothetical protein HB992_09785 [Listeria seeligeri]|uniref:hypothetical protein n=1 Tax=Listeria seeligeri TaxID=1640 RepID=UPI00162ABFD9|nr:hypothetical protein [Listeria seeligeri]MBC1734959.1 hypothetical protein [Listeria seeligeri]
MVKAKENTKSEESSKSEVVYKIMTPSPFTFVALDDSADLWADEKGVITTTDKQTKDWLLKFSNFKDVTNV